MMGGDRGFRVLVVDDNIEGGNSLASVLRLYGHAVKLARTEEEGRLIIGTKRVDIAIVDWWLDATIDGGGGRLIKSIRAAGIDTPCIMLTGVPETVMPSTIFSDLLSMPGVMVLHKPIDPERIIEALDQMMEGRALVSVDPHADSWADLSSSAR